MVGIPSSSWRLHFALTALRAEFGSYSSTVPRQSAKEARVREGEGERVGCDGWSARVAMGESDGDDGMGVGDEYGLGWNDEVVAAAESEGG